MASDTLSKRIARDEWDHIPPIQGRLSRSDEFQMMFEKGNNSWQAHK